MCYDIRVSKVVSQPTPDGRQRSMSFLVRVTPDEHARITALAAAWQASSDAPNAGLRRRRGVADYLRRRAFGEALPRRSRLHYAPIPSALLGGLTGLRRSLSRIGNNLNQLAKLGHEKGILPVGAVQSALDTLSDRLKGAEALEGSLDRWSEQFEVAGEGQ